MPRTIRMAALMLAAVFLAGSSGCRISRPSEPTASDDTVLYQGHAYPKLEGGGTVRVLSHNDQLTAVKPLLQEAYGVTVENVIVPYEQIPRRAEELIRAGQPLDLVYFTSTMYPLDLAKGLYLPLEDFVDFGDPVWSGSKKDADKLRYNGKLYIVPQISPDRYIWYNARLFREYGLETPLESYRAGRWTWERLKAAADVFATDEDGPYPIAGSLYGTVLSSRDCALLVSTPEGILATRSWTRRWPSASILPTASTAGTAFCRCRTTAWAIFWRRRPPCSMRGCGIGRTPRCGRSSGQGDIGLSPASPLEESAAADISRQRQRLSHPRLRAKPGGQPHRPDLHPDNPFRQRAV